jgi:hypothetical protein
LLVLQLQLAVVWGDITTVLGLLVVAVVQAVVVVLVQWLVALEHQVKEVLVGMVLPMWVAHQLLEVVVEQVLQVEQVFHLPLEMVETELHHL